MKKNELTKMRQKSVKELTEQVDKLRLEKAKAYTERKGGKDKELKKVKNTRRDIAQLLTIITEKSLSESSQEEEK